MNSRVFLHSPAMSAFLTFVVGETLAGRGSDIKAYTIAVEGLGESPDFDPQHSSRVRMLAQRLRKALADYYLEHGADDPVVIELPKGGYAPVFVPKSGIAASPGKDAQLAAATTPEPRIVVLPLKCQNGSSGLHDLALNLGESISSGLTSSKHLLVVPYHLAQGYCANGGDVSGVKDEFGARFALAGTVRPWREGVKAQISLIDCHKMRQVWSKSFADGLFPEDQETFEEDVALDTVGAIGGVYGVVAKIMGQTSVPEEAVTAQDALSFYTAALTQSPADETLSQARYLFEAAMANEPMNATLYSLLTEVYYISHIFGFLRGEDCMALAAKSISKALQIDPTDPFALCQEAAFYIAKGNYSLASKLLKHIGELAIEDPYILYYYGYCSSLLGDFEHGLPALERGVQLNPSIPKYYHMPFFLDHLARKEYDQALERAERFNIPDFFWSPLLFAVALAHLDRLEEAEQQYAELLELQPDFAERAHFYVNCMVVPESLRKMFFDALQKVGYVEPA